MSDQETPDNENVVAFRRKPKGEKSEKRARAATTATAAPAHNLDCKTSANLEPGDIVMCRVVRYVPGGFNVVVIPQNLHAYLPSNSNHQPGDEFSVIFVKAEKDRLLLSQRPANSASAPAKKTQGELRPGQDINCTILSIESSGYEVDVDDHPVPAYLQSNERHYVGDKVVATFVSIDKNGILLSDRVTSIKGEVLQLNALTDDSDDID